MSKSARGSPRCRLPPRNATPYQDACTLTASASQWISFAAVRALAGSLKTKSSATKVPVRVGEEIVPPTMPLKVALPFKLKGRSAGPCNATTNGRNSSRLEVETESRRVEEVESAPEADTRDAGVLRVNCESCNESAARS